MTSKVHSVAQLGLHCQIVEVEADVSRHLPSFVLVGMPDTAVQEARERIRSALENSGLPFPRSKVTVNLAPANVRKEGSLYDLAIAISILKAQDAVPLSEQDQKAVFLGELSLSGFLRPVRGILLAASYLKECGFARLYIPKANEREASYSKGLEIYSVASLSQLVEHLTGQRPLQPIVRTAIPSGKQRQGSFDFSDVRGQQQAKRALEIAAAGGHNVLMNGVPGSGKTMLAKSFISILPPLETEDVFEVSKIYSYAGMLSGDWPLVDQRPFRSPHHTASVASIVGGGTWPKPGEITLAHRGVLFLDEFPEFPRNVLEALRQPLEERVVTVSRVSGSVEFPAHFILIAAQNPCPCGFFGDIEKSCVCSPYQRIQYQRRISGPLLDRIDLHVHVLPVRRETLVTESAAESSEEVLARVRAARKRQQERFTGRSVWFLNGDMDHTLMKKYCQLESETQHLLLQASHRLHLSARSFYKVIKISRTIADLAGRTEIGQEDVLEALQYRSLNP